ncbi:MAG: 3-dehydroquinate synthase family protein [Phycisphaerales bacterium JB040]
MNTVRVNLINDSYPVHIAPGMLPNCAHLLGQALERTPARAFVMLDKGVPQHHADAMLASLDDASIRVTTHLIDPSERVKTIDTWAFACERLAASGQDRAEPVIALGGGITGDIAGFVAAAYRRGVPVVQCPSTLLAMVDASVGGKTGVNLPVKTDHTTRLLKNLIGAFHQPALVLADTDLLASLSARHFRAGLAESIKHACIATGITGDDLLGWTESNLARAAERDQGTVAELIRRSVDLKARVVGSDPRETAPSGTGGRALLNLGHTFAHAIETLPDLTPEPGDPSQAPLLHGEAVALGLVSAFASAAHLDLVDPDLPCRVASMLSVAGLPTRVAGLPDNEALVGAMGHDKKTIGGTLRLVLPTAPGVARVVEDPPPDAVHAGLDAIRA